MNLNIQIVFYLLSIVVYHSKWLLWPLEFAISNYLDWLGECHQPRLQELIVVRWDTLSFVSNGDIDVGNFLTDLANVLSRLWKSTKSMDRVIRVYQNAMFQTCRNRGLWENNLGNAFMWKYKNTHIPSLFSAVWTCKDAVTKLSIHV